MLHLAMFMSTSLSVHQFHFAVCFRYPEFRDREGHFTAFYWHLLALRLGFVIMFEVRGWKTKIRVCYLPALVGLFGKNCALGLEYGLRPHCFSTVLF